MHEDEDTDSTTQSELKQRATLRRKSAIKSFQTEKADKKSAFKEENDKPDETDLCLKRINRRLRSKQRISYEEDALKSPPPKRKCISNIDSISSKVVGYLEKTFYENKFLKDKQILQLSTETGLTEKQIREWFKEKSLKQNPEINTNTNESRTRRRISRNSFDK